MAKNNNHLKLSTRGIIILVVFIIAMIGGVYLFAQYMILGSRASGRIGGDGRLNKIRDSLISITPGTPNYRYTNTDATRVEGNINTNRRKGGTKSTTPTLNPSPGNDGGGGGG